MPTIGPRKAPVPHCPEWSTGDTADEFVTDGRSVHHIGDAKVEHRRVLSRLEDVDRGPCWEGRNPLVVASRSGSAPTSQLTLKVSTPIYVGDRGTVVRRSLLSSRLLPSLPGFARPQTARERVHGDGSDRTWHRSLARRFDGWRRGVRGVVARG
jgi:hypothetical protein